MLNHDLVYFEDIGTNDTAGIVCIGLISDTCCSDFEDPLTEKEKIGVEPNGNGSWIYPDGKFVRRECKSCVGITSDTFSVFRTDNATILYRNQNATQNISGIYRCEVPLAITIPHTYYVGIVDKSKGILKQSNKN